jgi:exonuclease III
LFFLQETFSTLDKEKELINTFSKFGKIFFGHSTSTHSRGVAILINKNVKYDIINSTTVPNGRQLLINIKLLDCNKILTLVSLYAPNDVKDRVNFFKDTQAWISQEAISNSEIILGGDLNCSLTYLDRANKKISTCSSNLFEFLNFNNLIDASSIKNTERQPEFTYIHPSDPLRNSRIDYILVSKTLEKQISYTNTTVAPAPDHKAVCVVLEFKERSRGRGLWKFNNSLLSDDSYLKQMTDIITRTQNEYDSVLTKQELFELLKIKIKEFSINFGINKKKLKNVKLQLLKKKLIS